MPILLPVLYKNILVSAKTLMIHLDFMLMQSLSFFVPHTVGADLCVCPDVCCILYLCRHTSLPLQLTFTDFFVLLSNPSALFSDELLMTLSEKWQRQWKCRKEASIPLRISGTENYRSLTDTNNKNTILLCVRLPFFQPKNANRLKQPEDLNLQSRRTVSSSLNIRIFLTWQTI